MFKSIVFIILGFILLIKGADFLVNGASGIAKKFHIPEIVIGLTIVSIGTSMPELLISITSGLNGHSDIAVGNSIGSNIANLFLILGATAMVREIKFKRETRLIEIPLSLIITIIFIILCNIEQSVSRVDGIILITIFILFIIYTIIMAFKGEAFDKEENEEYIKNDEKNFIIKSIILVILGILGLKFGGDFTVNNAVNIANYFNLSDKIISITILAIGTSLPELVTGISAALKGESDIAVGNVIGSNIFNMLLIVGTSSIINPIRYNLSYNKELIFLLLGTITLLLLPIIPPKNKMSRKNGLLYLSAYIGYMIIILIECIAL